VKYAQIFFSTYIFFSETHLQIRPFGAFFCTMAQTTRKVSELNLRRWML